MDVNGWSVIERLLRRRRKNQNDLARLLKISPAAITQSKQGDFQLSLESLEKIIHYLGAELDEEEEFYSKIVQNRIFEKGHSNILCRIIIIKREEP
jgi:transcriptional regulator with XRE-family HTH domain